MFKYTINGGRILRGNISVSGSKNAVLPVLSAAILNRGTTRILNCPDIADVRITLEILQGLGCEAHLLGNVAEIDASNITCSKIESKNACKCRSSITFLGALVSRTGTADVAYPGGCTIGQRPLDIHEEALRDMGVWLDCCESCIKAERTDTCEDKHVYLKFPSVGATENAMLAAAGRSGTTYIYGAAIEPEIVCLADYLKAIGTEIEGAGTGALKINGRETYENKKVDFTVIPDRIETATYLIAAAASGSGVRIRGCDPSHIAPIVKTLRVMGCDINEDPETNSIELIKGAAHKRLDSPGLIIADAYPSYPTDAQSLILPLLSEARGITFVTDKIFPERFSCADELIKMGAKVRHSECGIYIKGRRRLKNADVNSRDLRSGAAMIIAGITACGRSVVYDNGFIRRGYDRICEKLRGIGAEIRETQHQNLS